MLSERRSARSYIAACAMLAVFAFAFAPRASAEEFEGENDLLRKLNPVERLTYFGLQYSLNKYQRRQFLMLEKEEERARWLDNFWIQNDPTPATGENERRTEHEERVRLARKLFGMKKAPGWDHRGETLIRFGLPAARTKIPADIGFYEMVPPGELWYYHSLDMLVAFQNFNLKGEFIFAFERYGMSGRQQLDKLKAMAEFLTMQPEENIIMAPKNEIEAIRSFNPDDIDYVADPDLRAEMGRDLIAAIQAEKQQKSRNNFQKYMKENPVIYSFELEDRQLPVAFDITNFSGGGDVIRTEVNFEIPTREIAFTRKGRVLSADVRLDILVRDIDMNEVARAGDNIRPSQTGGDVWQGPSYLPGQLAIALKPGYYRIGIEATDLTSKRRGVFRTNIELEPLEGRLAMSDILFASVIRETDEIVKYQKGNLQVVPHPLHAYRIPYPLTFYFEIYGLDTDQEGLAFYSVSYRIIPASKIRKGPVIEEPPPPISSEFETSGFGSTQTQRLEIATDNLWKGTFQLIVSVMDRRTREVIEKRANFSVLE